MDAQSILLTLFGISSLHAAYKAVHQAREQRRLRGRELRWRQSEQARLILNEMEDDEYAAAAMLTLDYDGRVFTIGEQSYSFSTAQIKYSLRVGNDQKYTDEEVLIRDCYDHLFYQFERIAQWIDVELINIYDVRFPLSYLAECMTQDGRRSVIERYLSEYRYYRTLWLLLRFRSWDGDIDARSSPPVGPSPTVWSRLCQFIVDTEPLKAPDFDKISAKSQ